jgi:hypothetical protein
LYKQTPSSEIRKTENGSEKSINDYWYAYKTAITIAAEETLGKAGKKGSERPV